MILNYNEKKKNSLCTVVFFHDYFAEEIHEIMVLEMFQLMDCNIIYLEINTLNR
jgi:hypothetical protein